MFREHSHTFAKLPILLKTLFLDKTTLDLLNQIVSETQGAPQESRLPKDTLLYRSAAKSNILSTFMETLVSTHYQHEP
jgi:hypothetical protein